MSSSARFLICISNDGYQASLETRKVYQEIPDPDDLYEALDPQSADLGGVFF